VLEHANRNYNTHEYGERVTQTGYSEVLAHALTSLGRAREAAAVEEVPLAIYETLLRACSANHGVAAMAQQVLAEMKSAGCPVDGLVTQGLQLRALGKLGLAEEVLAVLHRLTPFRQVEVTQCCMRSLTLF